MKYVLIALAMMLSAPALAQESCQQTSQDVNTPVPNELKDAKIIIRTADGKEREMSANEFKVVKRKQQFKVKERVVIEKTVCPACVTTEVVRIEKAKENKNLVMLGVAYDYTSLDSEIQGNVVKLYSNKGPVLDLTYLRRRVFDSNFGLGIGINTNGAPRGVLGLEF